MTVEETGFNITLTLLAFCIFMSNLVVLMAIIKAEHLHIPSNIFVAGMALADASVGAIGLPLRFVVSLNLRMDYYSCLYLNFIYLYTLYSSLYMLLAFTFDRLYAIRFPLRYHGSVDCKDAAIGISIVWGVGFVVEVFVATLIVEVFHHESYEGICSFLAVVPTDYLLYVNFFGKFLGTVLALVIVNIYIVCVVARHKRHNVAVTGGRNVLRKRDLKAEKMLVSMITVFIICWLPIYIYDARVHFGLDVDKTVHRVTLINYFLNSFLNPFIYAVSNKNIRRACIKLIMCRPLNRTMSTQVSSLTTRNPNTSRSAGHLSSREGSARGVDIGCKETLETESNFNQSQSRSLEEIPAGVEVGSIKSVKTEQEPVAVQ